MSILTNIARQTTRGSGGIKTMYAGKMSSIASYTTSGSTVETITLVPGTNPFITIAFEPQESEVVSHKSTLRDIAFDSTGKFSLKGISQSTQDALMALASETVFLIVETANGTYIVPNDLDFGTTIGIALKTGSKVSDPNGYDLSIKGYEMKYLPYVVNPTILTGLLTND